MPYAHWIIQENQNDPIEVSRLSEAIKSEGDIAHLVHLTKSLDIPPIDDLPDDAGIVCHGPGLLTRALLSPRLRKGLFFDPETFCWQAFSRGWGAAILSSDGRVTPFSEAQEHLRNTGTAFVRPNDDSKLFEGGVYDATGLVAAAQKSAISPETLVVVASPLKIEAEWRFFIVNREIVGCSEYRRWGKPSNTGSVPHAAIDLASGLAEQWSPAHVYCLDLASTNDRIGVVEANCFNASRFYGTAINRVVRAVGAYVLSNH